MLVPTTQLSLLLGSELKRANDEESSASISIAGEQSTVRLEIQSPKRRML